MKKLSLILAMIIITFSCSAFSQKVIYSKDSTKTVFTKIDHKSNYVKVQRFYKNGVLMETGQYNGSRRIGVWTSYHENGNVHMTAYFKNDKKSGCWTVHDTYGKIIMKLTYRRNKLIEGIQWEPDGLVLLVSK